MIKEVYRPSRWKNGKRIVGRLYRGKYRFDPREQIKYVALHSDDKQVAEQRLTKIVREEQHEREGLIALSISEKQLSDRWRSMLKSSLQIVAPLSAMKNTYANWKESCCD
jgi:hypothetical protein